MDDATDFPAPREGDEDDAALDAADGLEAIFPIIATPVLPDSYGTFEDATGSDEIQAMLGKVRSTFGLVPLEG